MNSVHKSRDPKLSAFVLLIILNIACSPSDNTDAGNLNTLSEDEKRQGWELLFDGESLNGWKRYNHDTIGPGWRVMDGAIVCDPKAVADSTGQFRGSLITTKQFSNFDLRFEWKISEGGNSGVMYHVVESRKYQNDYETGPEYQILDEKGWTGEKLKATQRAASNYDMYEASGTKKLLPSGEWNAGRIIYNNGHVEHWLNGQLVVSFDENSPDFQSRLQQSKWTNYPDWNKSKTGSISLQDHSDPVYFRNIRIKQIKDQ